MAITNFLAKNFFPEGNLQQIKAQSLSPSEYNIRATEDQIKNMFGGRGGILKDLIAPAATFSLSLPYDTGQGIVRAFDKFQPDTGILDYDTIPSAPTFKNIGASIAAERPFASAYERMTGASSGLANRLKDLSGIFNTSAMASELAPTNINLNDSSAAMMFDRITDPNLMRVQNFRAIENEPFKEIPGFNFIDAPTSLMSRLQNPKFLNNPAVQNPLEKIGSGITSVTDKAKSGFGKGINLGKAALSGIISLATGVPFLGNALTGIASQFENRPLEASVIDEFGNVYDPEELNKLNALGGYYTAPARSARRRTKRIAKMLERQKLGKKISQRNLEKLQAQERAQAAAQRAAVDRMFQEGRGGRGQDFTGGRFDRAGSREAYDRDPTGFSGSS